MAYTPINIDAYTNAYSGAIAGMAISGWIVDPTSADYSNVATIAGAFAQAFDVVWNNGTELNWLQIQSIQSVCQEQFAGHAPGSLDSAALAQAANWAVPAAACAALVLQGDSFVASEGITPNTPGGGGSSGPIFRQLWLDTTKPDGGNGAIDTPYNTWAGALGPIAVSGGTAPWVINLAQGIDASGTPIPNIGAGGHDTGRVKLQGPIQQSSWVGFENGNIVVTGLDIGAQDGGDFALDITNLTVIGITVTPTTFIMTGENAILSSIFQAAGSVFGFSNLINCSLTSIDLASWNLRMQGGTLDSSISVDNGFLDDVTLLSSCDFRFATSLNLTNCRFEAGCVLQCSANQQLNVDLDTWGSMVAAGVTFPDTFPTMVITPWVPVIGQVAVIGTTSIDPGGVETVDVGVIAPQEAEASTACITSFATAVNSKLTIVGSFIDASRHLNVLISNNDVGAVDLINPTYTVTYLPRISP
jgi:hypothetical protein